MQKYNEKLDASIKPWNVWETKHAYMKRVRASEEKEREKAKKRERETGSATAFIW